MKVVLKTHTKYKVVKCYREMTKRSVFPKSSRVFLSAAQLIQSIQLCAVRAHALLRYWKTDQLIPASVYVQMSKDVFEPI